MLSRFIRHKFSSLSKDLNSRITEIESRVKKVIPPSIFEETTYSFPEEPAQKTIDQKLEELDGKIAKIEALREAGRPEEIRIKNLPMKYGRTGRHPAYPWYGQEVPHEDRIPYLADRIGNYSKRVPAQNELMDALEITVDTSNPLFYSHFVQEPPREPDPDVNFAKGEVIYENPDATNGVMLARQTGGLGILYVGFYMLQTLLSGRSVYPINNEGMDQRADYLNPANNFVTDMYGGEFTAFETIGLFGFVSPLIPIMGAITIGLIKASTEGIISKLQYSQDKDLIFVTKPAGIIFNKEIEEVYETTHLQILPPAPRTGYGIVSEREYATITCMNTNQGFRVSTDKKYWNPEVYEEIHDHLYSLWD
jgi:hypothetical protein